MSWEETKTIFLWWTHLQPCGERNKEEIKKERKKHLVQVTKTKHKDNLFCSFLDCSVLKFSIIFEEVHVCQRRTKIIIYCFINSVFSKSTF